MRIIGYLPHPSPSCKVTVFKMGNKLTVKFEEALLEQTFKFRESEQLQGLNDIKRLIDKDFVQKVEARFEEMRQQSSSRLRQDWEAHQEEEDDLEII